MDDLALQALADVIRRVTPDGPPQVALVTPSTVTGELRSLAELLAPMEGEGGSACLFCWSRDLDMMPPPPPAAANQPLLHAHDVLQPIT